MPQVVKQKPEAKPATPASNNAEITGMKVNVYGQGKMGKTRLVCTFPKPLMLIGTEDGTKSICTGKKERMKLKDGTVVYQLLKQGKPIGVDFARIRKSETFDELLPLVRDNYASAGLDHGGGLMDILFREVLGYEPDQFITRTYGMAQRETWGVINSQFIERVSRLLDLADRHGTNVVIIAHERNFGDESNSDIIRAKVGPALTPGTAQWLDGACDYICQCFVRPGKKAVEVTTNGQKETTYQPTGKIEYCLRIVTDGTHRAGFRVPEGVVLPDSVVDPSYEKLKKIIHGEKV